MNTTGAFVVRATRVGRDTALARIVELVQRAQGSKAPLQRLADRISELFVPAVLRRGRGDVRRLVAFGPEPRLTLALTAFIGVVIIACPCAMGLATPTAIMVATGRGAEAGILVRSGEALEAAGRVDTVVLRQDRHPHAGPAHRDGDPAAPMVSTRTTSSTWRRRWSGRSEHPLGAAVVEAALDRGLAVRTVEAFEAVAGRACAARSTGGR